MIFVISLISTLFILLILFLLLEYRSRSRRALARRMRYYSGEMDTQEKPKESKPLTERLMDILRSGGKLLSNIRHARGLDFQMQKAGIPLLGTEFLILLGLSAFLSAAIVFVVTKKLFAGVLVAVVVVVAEWVFVLLKIRRVSGGSSSGGSSSGGTSGGSSDNSPEIHEVPTDLDFTDDEKNQVGNGTEATGVEDGGVNGKETASLSGARKFPVIPVVIGVLVVAAGAAAAVIFTKKKKPVQATDNANAGTSPQGGYGTGSGNGQAYGEDMLDKTINLKAQQGPAQRPPVQQNVQVPNARQVGVVALGGGLRGRGFGISGQGVTIGRDPSCEAAFPQGSEGSNKVSRRHCKLYFENGRLLLVDLGSTNGTFMADGRRLTPMQPVPVRPGDRFYLDNPDNMFEIRM